MFKMKILHIVIHVIQVIYYKWYTVNTYKSLFNEFLYIINRLMITFSIYI